MICGVLGCMGLQTVTLKENEKIFEVLERLGISREAVVIFRDPKRPGKVSRLPNGKLEIIVDSEVPFDAWLVRLEEIITAAEKQKTAQRAVGSRFNRLTVQRAPRITLNG